MGTEGVYKLVQTKNMMLRKTAYITFPQFREVTNQTILGLTVQASLRLVVLGIITYHTNLNIRL